jgi:hypothetical protein
MKLKIRVFNPFPAYIEYLKRNNIPFSLKRQRLPSGASFEYLEFNAEDRFKAKEDYFGLCGVSGYIFGINEETGSEQILQPI